jgi:hypothetical protein
MSQEKFFLTSDEFKRRNAAFRKESEQLRKSNKEYNKKYYPEEQTLAEPITPVTPGKVK